MDVLAWFARATLDVIGEAGTSFLGFRCIYAQKDSRNRVPGFGYAFNSLSAASHTAGGKEENELARAFAVIFSTARKFRVATILQVWFPALRRFVSIFPLRPL